MIVECQEKDHRMDPVTGAVSCPDSECLAAALFCAADPMLRLPERRPRWILSSPHSLDQNEVEALAILGDAGLVPQIVAPDTADEQSDAWPSEQRLRFVG